MQPSAECFDQRRVLRKFNTKVDVGLAVGVEHKHPVLLKHATKMMYNKTPRQASDEDYDLCTAEEQAKIDTDAEEQYLAHAMLHQSGSQHKKLRDDLKNNFTTGDDTYPQTRQQTLHLMDQYTKSTPRVMPNERETSFAQQGKKKFDYWKNKECHNCGEKGHPSYKCPKKEDDKDDRSRSSKKSSNALR